MVAAGFAPVKGTRHLTYESLTLDVHGPIGDRSFCLVDVAARRVLKTVRHPSLMSVIARLADGVLSVAAPGSGSVAAVPNPSGATITCDYWGRPVPLELVDGPFDELFSDHLGRPVRLAAAPRGGVVFGDPISLVTTASLAHVDVPDAARFRPTLVVETDEPSAETTWFGREFTVGTARIRIGGPITRCAVIDHDPRTGIRDVPLLKELAASSREPTFGVFATVVRPGVVTPYR